MGRPQDVIFQRPKEVGRGRPQHVGRGHLFLVLQRSPYGYVHRTSFGTSLGRPQDVILLSGNLYPNEYSQEFHYYSFDISLDRCVERCNTFNSLSNKVCVANKTEEINLIMLKMIARKNESKTLTKHILCECKYRFDGRNVIQINGQWWNNDKC